MTRATLLRVLLAVALATATGVREGARANSMHQQRCPPTTPAGPGPRSTGGGGSSSNNNAGWYILGGVIAVVAGWAIKTQLFPDPPGSGGPPPSRPLPPDQPLISQQSPPANQPPVWPPSVNTAGGRPGGGQGNSGTPCTQALRRGFDVPPLGAPIVPNELILDIPSSVPASTLDRIAASSFDDPRRDHHLSPHRSHDPSLAYQRWHFGRGYDPQRGR